MTLLWVLVGYVGHGPGLVLPRTGSLGLPSYFILSAPSSGRYGHWETKTGRKLESECSECFVVIWVTS